MFKSFEEWKNQNVTPGEIAEYDLEAAWEAGATLKEKEMMEFAEWWHVAPFGLFVTTEEAFEHWKDNVKKEGE